MQIYSLQLHSYFPTSENFPSKGIIRIYTDAAINSRMIITGKGIIARHWTGKIMRAKGVVEKKKGDARMEETLTIRMTLQMAREAGWRKIAILSDCTKLGTIMCKNGHLMTILDDIDDLTQGFE